MRVGLLGDVVDGFEGDAVGEGGVAGNGDHVLMSARKIAGDGHAKRGGERSTRVPCAVAVMLAFSAQHEAIEAAGLADSVKAVETAGEHLVDISLMADVKKNAVLGCTENGVECDGELDDAKIGAEMAAGFGEGLNEAIPNLLGELGHLLVIQEFKVVGRMNGLQNRSHGLPSPGKIDRACGE